MSSETTPWRARAAEYRAFAEESHDAQVRAGYLQLARHCEALAERQDQVSRSRTAHNDNGAGLTKTLRHGFE